MWNLKKNEEILEEEIVTEKKGHKKNSEDSIEKASVNDEKWITLKKVKRGSNVG